MSFEILTNIKKSLDRCLQKKYQLIDQYSYFLLMDNHPQYYCEPAQIQFLLWRESQGYSQSFELLYEQEKIVGPPKLKNFINKANHFTLGALTFKNAMKQLCFGTGVLISKNVVLTAAHNLYDRKYGKSTDHKFYLGANGATDSYLEIQSFHYPPQFENSKDVKYDFGIIKLKSNLQMNQGYTLIYICIHLLILINLIFNEFLKLFVPCQKCIKENKKKLSIYGYPLYADNYSKNERQHDNYEKEYHYYANQFLLFLFHTPHYMSAAS